jgi:hypothetical protein
MSGPSCTAAACRTCTACYHGNHGACRRTVWCPDDQISRICRCCGTKEEK